MLQAKFGNYKQIVKMKHLFLYDFIVTLFRNLSYSFFAKSKKKITKVTKNQIFVFVFES